MLRWRYRRAPESQPAGNVCGPSKSIAYRCFSEVAQTLVCVPNLQKSDRLKSVRLPRHKRGPRARIFRTLERAQPSPVGPKGGNYGPLGPSSQKIFLEDKRD